VRRSILVSPVAIRTPSCPGEASDAARHTIRGIASAATASTTESSGGCQALLYFEAVAATLHPHLQHPRFSLGLALHDARPKTRAQAPYAKIA
jgi:hypothetical protein